MIGQGPSTAVSPHRRVIEGLFSKKSSTTTDLLGSALPLDGGSHLAIANTPSPPRCARWCPSPRCRKSPAVR